LLNASLIFQKASSSTQNGLLNASLIFQKANSITQNGLLNASLIFQKASSSTQCGLLNASLIFQKTQKQQKKLWYPKRHVNFRHYGDVYVPRSSLIYAALPASRV
jgi:hypothetical protein